MQLRITHSTFHWKVQNKVCLGTDGLKTGSSDTANYNHTITTKRNLELIKLSWVQETIKPWWRSNVI